MEILGSHLQDNNLILLADHDSLIDGGRDASTPPAFEHPEVLTARERELNVLQGASLTDVYGVLHSASFGDFASTSKDSFPKGYTFGYTSDGKASPHDLRRIDKIHVTKEILDHAKTIHATFL